MDGEKGSRKAERELNAGIGGLRARLGGASAGFGTAQGPQNGDFQLGGGFNTPQDNGRRRDGGEEDAEFEGPVDEGSYVYEVLRSRVDTTERARVDVATDSNEGGGRREVDAEWATCGATYPSKRRRKLC